MLVLEKSPSRTLFRGFVHWYKEDNRDICKNFPIGCYLRILSCVETKRMNLENSLYVT